MSGDGDAPGELRVVRVALAAGAIVYLGWWGVVQALLPGAYNPLPGRLAVVAAFLLALAATMVSGWARTNAQLLFSACAWLLTAHYVYLVHENGGEAAWWGGMLVTVPAVAALMNTQRQLIAYSIFTLALATAETVIDRQMDRSVFLPGVATVLLLSNLALRSRLRAEKERLAAAHAREQRDHAEEVSRFKTMVLGLVSHELLTPLQSMQLGVEALVRYPDTTPTRRAQREATIERSLKRLRNLIQSLLDYVRLDAGQLALKDVDFDPVPILSEMVDDLGWLAQAKGLELSLDPADVPPVRSDPGLFRMVVMNLVTNAIKYTHEGKVEVALSHDDAGHRVVVRDTGSGIAPEDLGRIFEPFTQLEPLEHKHTHGVGLGLALAQQAVTKLGGCIEVSSVVGSGSTFTVVVPRETAATKSARPPHRHKADPAPATRPN